MSPVPPARLLGRLTALQTRLRLEMRGSHAPGYRSAYRILVDDLGYRGWPDEVLADVQRDLAAIRLAITHSWS